MTAVTLATLERQQAERIEHLNRLQALVDRKQREIDNLREMDSLKAAAIEAAPRRLAIVK